MYMPGADIANYRATEMGVCPAPCGRPDPRSAHAGRAPAIIPKDPRYTVVELIEVVGGASRVAGDHDDLPAVRGLVVGKDVDDAVVPADPDVAVVGAIPATDDLEHLDAMAAQLEPPRGLLAAMARSSRRAARPCRTVCHGTDRTDRNATARPSG